MDEARETDHARALTLAALRHETARIGVVADLSPAAPEVGACVSNLLAMQDACYQFDATDASAARLAAAAEAYRAALREAVAASVFAEAQAA